MKRLVKRPRRLRKNEALRNLVQETSVSVGDLICPLFTVTGNNIKNEIKSMPNIFQMSSDLIVEECKKIHDQGIPGVILFGIPEKKDELGTDAYNENGIIQKTVSKIKKELPDLLVITDLCFCQYTSHGHCGIIENGTLNNDKTLEIIYKTAVSQAQAGSDIIAPSLMIDSMVDTIRTALDKSGFSDIAILSYSAKYESAFYGPFRDGGLSSPAFGDRKTYQMNPANSREALKEVLLDIDEGADMVMIKPALAYLDIINQIKNNVNVPIAAFNVSGEYSMIKAASQNGWIDEKKTVLEIFYSLKRAGADFIITYFAKDLTNYLK